MTVRLTRRELPFNPQQCDLRGELVEAIVAPVVKLVRSHLIDKAERVAGVEVYRMAYQREGHALPWEHENDVFVVIEPREHGALTVMRRYAATMTYCLDVSRGTDGIEVVVDPAMASAE